MLKLVAGLYAATALSAFLLKAVILGQGPLIPVIVLIVHLGIAAMFLNLVHWARWLIVIGAFFGCVISYGSFLFLDGDPVGKFSFAGLLFILFGSVDAVIFGIGCFSKEINEVFDT